MRALAPSRAPAFGEAESPTPSPRAEALTPAPDNVAAPLAEIAAPPRGLSSSVSLPEVAPAATPVDEPAPRTETETESPTARAADERSGTEPNAPREAAAAPSETEPVAQVSAAGEASLEATEAPASESAAPAPAGAPALEGASPVAAAGAAEPEAEAPATPEPSSAIAPVARAVRGRAATARSHASTDTLVGAAHAAAIDPATEQRRGAAVGTVAHLASAEPQPVARNDFKTRLTEALRAAVPTPNTAEEAQQTSQQGAARASGVLRNEVSQQSQAAAGPIAQAAQPAAEVAPNSVPAPASATLTAPQAGPPPEPVSPAAAVPPPVPAARLDYSRDRQGVDQVMAENNVSREQLQQANEPEFGAAAQAQESAEAHQATLPSQYREGEAGMRAEAREGATTALEGGLADIHGERVAALTQVAASQSSTRTVDAATRARITTEIDAIKDATRRDVQSILEQMERGATEKFTAGLQRAESAYQAVFDAEKGTLWQRFTGFFTGENKERVDRAFVAARRAYQNEVSATIDEVADYVEGQLTRAKERVTQGRNEVDAYVSRLDESVRGVGEEARSTIAGEFDNMGSEIDARSDALINTLAQKYGESQQRMQALETQLRDENKTFWERAYEATAGVVQKIVEFKNMLMSVVSGAVDVVEQIVKHPIRFLGNLIRGVKAGLDAFVGNIGEHLKQGLLGWLFGALSDAGIQLPERFDLKGIFGLIFQVLGLTYANIRSRAVAIVGEPLVARLEQAAEIFIILKNEGLAGLWEMLKERISSLKDTVLEEIKSWVISRVIRAGIQWIVSLLNPAAALIKAVKAIYDIVMFFIERGRQILELVRAITSSLAAIVAGNLGQMASAVEGALARAIPVAISFLASLLGLGGISDQIRAVIAKIQAPVNRAIDWVIGKAVALVRRVGQLFSGRRATQAGPENLGSAKTAARQAILQRFASGATLQQVQHALPEIKTQLEPMGLKSLTLGAPDPSGHIPILAEASPMDAVCTLIAKRVTVAVSAKIQMRADHDVPIFQGIVRTPRLLTEPSESVPATTTPDTGDLLLPAPRVFPSRSSTLGESLTWTRPGSRQVEHLQSRGGTGFQAVLPPVPQPGWVPASAGTQPSAGTIIEPRPGSTSFEVVSWNTSRPVGDTNISHAERQFTEWFSSRPEAWRKRVAAVQIQVEGLPICPNCEHDLKEVRRQSPWIEEFQWQSLTPEANPELEAE